MARRGRSSPVRLDAVFAANDADLGLRHAGPVAPHVWLAAVGPRIAARTRPLRVERGALVVRVESPVWGHELGFLADAIVARLRERRVDVARLVFAVGPIEPPRALRPGRVRVVPALATLPDDLEATLAAVPDESLRGAIRAAARANLAWQVERTKPVPPKTGARAARAIRGPVQG